MHRRSPVRLLLCVGVAACQVPTPEAGSQSEDEVVATSFQATLGEANAETPEIATEQLIATLAEGNAVLLDTAGSPRRRRVGRSSGCAPWGPTWSISSAPARTARFRDGASIEQSSQREEAVR